ncbi:2-amino-4-hydroxy-6-hydroxymethyldihydropteridine diphosphokinase [Ancylomarina longa]|uniref:2-amino-4-hydroxy-6-hydroxymethyldihydropteridine pyrophosphokinase n=1 Tax=Ancylomarina longa TaxID=2487017 RepID=A0A434AX18_9BACT|nr:2-amino-4-hydroxy-6-hydroxymethyldihydropteridine diphosphokinase [Ancylomarina longa]RUT79042.1 2-amino-4-hydroxy-6-hydroxymethyldihydropteridine diphosphokinase [Ancylomarina longa]
MNNCIIGIGSNINPEQNIRKMICLLSKDHLVRKHSSWIKTAPIGITDQDNFLNGALRLETQHSREEFNQYLKQLEDRMGRDRSLPKFGPRIIDLDIVVWNGEIVDEDYHTRDFLKNSVDQLL